MASRTEPPSSDCPHASLAQPRPMSGSPWSSQASRLALARTCSSACANAASSSSTSNSHTEATRPPRISLTASRDQTYLSPSRPIASRSCVQQPTSETPEPRSSSRSASRPPSRATPRGWSEIPRGNVRGRPNETGSRVRDGRVIGTDKTAYGRIEGVAMAKMHRVCGFVRDTPARAYEIAHSWMRGSFRQVRAWAPQL
jgi:hypothetical protein